MKTNFAQCFLLICSIVWLLAACAPAQPVKVITPTLTASPSPTITSTAVVYQSTPNLYGAPTLTPGETLDTACRVTINLFYSHKQGDDFQTFRDLFAPSRPSMADSYRVPRKAAILLELMTTMEKWQRDYPNGPIPPSFDPLVYYVKVTWFNDDPRATPAYLHPFSTYIYMLSDGPFSCKIVNMGGG